MSSELGRAQCIAVASIAGAAIGKAIFETFLLSAAISAAVAVLVLGGFELLDRRALTVDGTLDESNDVPNGRAAGVDARRGVDDEAEESGESEHHKQRTNNAMA